MNAIAEARELAARARFLPSRSDWERAQTLLRLLADDCQRLQDQAAATAAELERLHHAADTLEERIGEL